MREIKFRAFDKDKKQMRKPFDLEHVGATFFYMTSTGFAAQYDPSYARRNVEIMQFTGLRDKTGKEIYEGDILTHASVAANWANGKPQDDFGPKEIAGVVVQANRNPYPIHRDFQVNPYRVVKYIRAQFFPLESYPPEEMVIVGNVYEHGELLDVPEK